MLAWLKESGAYDFLNKTLPALKAADLPAELAQRQIKALEVLAQANATLANNAQALKQALVYSWLKESMRGLGRLQNATVKVASLAGQLTKPPSKPLPEVELPALGGGALRKQVKKANFTINDVLTGLDVISAKLNVTQPGAEGKPVPTPQQYAAGLAKRMGVSVTPAPGAKADGEALRSAVVLSWLKESGAFDKLVAFNKAAEELNQRLAALQGALAKAPAAPAEVPAPAAAAAANLTRLVNDRVAAPVAAAAAEAAAEAAAAADAQVKALTERYGAARAALAKLQEASKRPAAAAKGALVGATKAADAAVERNLAAANRALADAGKQLQELRTAKLPAATNEAIVALAARAEAAVAATNSTMTAVEKQLRTVASVLQVPAVQQALEKTKPVALSTLSRVAPQAGVRVASLLAGRPAPRAPAAEAAAAAAAPAAPVAPKAL